MNIGIQTWGTEGDVRPMIALAAGLAARGHRVTLAVTEIGERDYAHWARRYGFELRPVGSPVVAGVEKQEAVRRRCIQAGNPIRQAEIIMRDAFDPAVASMYEASRALCAENELVIGHFFVYPLQVAAERAGVPWVTLNVVHSAIPSRHTRPTGIPDLGGWFNPWGWKLVSAAVNRIFGPRVNTLRRRAGLAPVRDVLTETWASRDLNLVAVSPHLFQRPADWPPHHQVCGFLNLPRAQVEDEDELSPDLRRFLENGEQPPVYMTFGSMMPTEPARIMETVALWREAAERAGCRAILQTPRSVLSRLPRDDRLRYVDRAPHDKVFPRCAAVVHHGGAGTTQSALMAGVPSVVVAHLSDQFFWGDELVRLGATRRMLLRKTVKARELAREISAVRSSASMKQRAVALGRKMASERGVENAVRSIESRFGSRPERVEGVGDK